MKKDLSYYLSLKYPVLITEAEEKGKRYFEAEIPELPGCGAQAKNQSGALKRLGEAKKLWIAARLKRNLPIPEPVSEDDYSGRFLLRITPELHRRLASGARNEALSLNQYIRKVVESSLTLERVLDKVNKLEQEIIGLCRIFEFRNESNQTAYSSMHPFRGVARYFRPNVNANQTEPMVGGSLEGGWDIPQDRY